MQEFAGGVQVAGSPTISHVYVRHWDEYMIGGFRISGASTDAFNWSETRALGGIAVSGTAANSSSTASIGTLALALPVISASLEIAQLAAQLPKLTVTLFQDNITASLPKLTMSLGPEANRLGATLPVLSPSLGPEGAGGVITTSLPFFSAESSGVVGTGGEIDTALPLPDVYIVGGTNSIETTLTVVDSALQGAVGHSASLEARLPAVLAITGGQAAAIGQANIYLPLVQADASGIVGTLAQISATLPSIRAAVEANAGAVGTLSVALRPLEADTTGYTQILATITVELPLIDASASDVEGTLSYLRTVVMNTVTTAVSEYDNYAFNSFCEFNGRYLAVGPSGLFELDAGDLDDTATITAGFTSGQLDFKSAQQKRISDFYVGLRANGDLLLTISTDEDEPVEYPIETFGVDRLHQRRVITAKGAVGRYWQFGVTNTDGCDFEIDAMTFAVAPSARRI
jgi:hypothetical protein